MTTTPPPGPPPTPGGFGIDPRLGAAALRAPAASKQDSRSQAILKFQHLSSLDYRVRHELPVICAVFFHLMAGSPGSEGNQECIFFTLNTAKCDRMPTPKP